MKNKTYRPTIILSFLIVFSLLKAKAYEPGSLVGYWSFDEGTGQTAADGSGLGQDFILSSAAAWEAGREGNALSIPYGEFASIEDALLNSSFPCTSTGSPVEAMTVAAWVYLDNNVGRQSILVKEAENQRGFVFSVTDGVVTFQVHNEAGEKLIVQSSGTNIETGQWYHVAATYQYVSDWGSTVKLYVNGVEDYVDNAVPGPIKTCNARLVVGAYLYHDPGTYNNYSEGLFDEIYVYSSVLSEAEISNLMENGTPVGLNLKKQPELSYRLYPNPSSLWANIEFTLLKSGETDLSIYDIQGRLISTLVNDCLPAGNHIRYFDASGLSQGVYVSKLKVGEAVVEKKLIITK